jgi:hypothetical protein
MKQDTKDIVVKVLTEWNQYEVRMNFDTDSTELISNFINIMRAMTFSSNSIMNSLREVADDIESEMKFYNNNEKNDEIVYDTAD